MHSVAAVRYPPVTATAATLPRDAYAFDSSCPDTCPVPDARPVVEWGEPPMLRGDRSVTALGRLPRLQRSSHHRLRAAAPHDSLFGNLRSVFPHGTVARRRGPDFPPERTSTMCAHNSPCPVAEAPDREAARPVTHRPEQGWSLLCNGVLLFEDTGELLPDGRVIAPHRSLGRARAAA